MLRILENLPYFDRIAGQRWFREYVADPVPGHVCNIRGGYRGGGTSNVILTLFDYEPPFERPPFPVGWEPGNQAAASLLANLVESHTGTKLNISKGYIKPLHPSGGASAWLLLDESANKGALYEAAYNPRGG